MSAATLIREARAEGVLLSLTPAGTLKVAGNEAVVRRWAPTLRLHRQALLDALRSALSAFKFDLVEQDIAGGASAEELRRANNLCWHLMQADGLAFDEAMRIAAGIVVSCPPAQCKAGYDDPHELWRRLVGGQVGRPDSTGKLQEVT